MANSVNKVILVGHLGADPEMRATPSGVQIAKLRIATSESWTDKVSGQRQDKTEWHNVVAYDRLASICERFLGKGRLVYVEGSLTTRSWDDKDTGQKRYMTEIKARDIQMLGPRPDRAGGAGAGSAEPHEGPTGGGSEPEDDVPF